MPYLAMTQPAMPACLQAAQTIHLAYLMAGPHARLELDPATRY